MWARPLLMLLMLLPLLLPQQQQKKRQAVAEEVEEDKDQLLDLVRLHPEVNSGRRRQWVVRWAGPAHQVESTVADCKALDREPKTLFDLADWGTVDIVGCWGSHSGMDGNQGG